MPLVPHSAALFGTAAIFLAVLSAARPRWALALLLAALPFFTHQLHNPTALRLIALVAAVEIGYLVRLAPVSRETWQAASRNPLLVLGALRLGAAFLSLSSLPLLAVWQQHAAVLAILPAAEWLHYAGGWLTLPETAREFSITSAFLSVQGFLLAVIVWRETRTSRATVPLLAAAITGGLVVFVALGLLEGFGIVRLDALRGNVGVGVRAGAVQSTAGNPGWFAQYVVYALPYSLVLLLGRGRSTARLAAFTLVAAASGVALVLCFQRGGWLAGALALVYLAVGAAQLPGRRDAPVRGGRPSLARSAAFLTLAAALAVGGAWAWITSSDSKSEPLPAAAYVARFKSILNADRLPYVRASVRIAVLHPILGGGNESFAYRYRMYFEDPGGVYAQSGIRVPMGTSAHNVYLQTLCGSGVAGLLLLVASFAAAAWMAVRTLRAGGVAPGQRLALLVACGSLLGIAGYGLVQEVFYVHALRLLFFVAIGIIAGASADVAWPPRTSRILWIALLALFPGHLWYEYVRPGPARLLRSALPTGLFAEERDPGGRPFQWTTDEATWPVPEGGSSYALDVRSLAPFAQRVEITACGAAARTRVQLDDHNWRTVSARLYGCSAGDRLILRVTPAWRPSWDERLLGVMAAGAQLR
jgi:O-antigen ligase